MKGSALLKEYIYALLTPNYPVQVNIMQQHLAATGLVLTLLLCLQSDHLQYGSRFHTPSRICCLVHKAITTTISPLGTTFDVALYSITQVPLLSPLAWHDCCATC
jgi:hypothetical protein